MIDEETRSIGFVASLEHTNDAGTARRAQTLVHDAPGVDRLPLDFDKRIPDLHLEIKRTNIMEGERMRGWMGATAGACAILTGTWSLLAQRGGQARDREPIIGGPCEGCEAVFQGLSDALATHARIAPADEPGEPMHIAGTVFDRQGRPASGVIVYAYHTNARGVYPPEDRFRGLAAYRHGRLRGWAVTDERGRYTFDTIRPASYPDQVLPAHVHMHVIEVGRCTYYIDSIHFDDDPLLTSAEAADAAGRGGSGVVHPLKDAGGVWSVRRDVRLGEGVPGYERGCETTSEPDTGYDQDVSLTPDSGGW